MRFGRSEGMTIEEAKEEIPTMEYFLEWACGCCTANDWYCPSYCNTLLKAQRMPFEKILKSFARNDGDIRKVCQYIKYARV